jgi:hypothetical protein
LVYYKFASGPQGGQLQQIFWNFKTGEWVILLGAQPMPRLVQQQDPEGAQDRHGGYGSGGTTLKIRKKNEKKTEFIEPMKKN